MTDTTTPADERHWTPINLVHLSESELRHVRAYAEAYAEQARDASQPAQDAWRDAVIDELVCCHIYCAEHDNNPRKAIQDAISWHCQVALDPQVSSDAQALIDRGKAEANQPAQEPVAEVMESGVLSPSALVRVLRNYLPVGTKLYAAPPAAPATCGKAGCYYLADGEGDARLTAEQVEEVLSVVRDLHPKVRSALRAKLESLDTNQQEVADGIL